MTRTFHFQLKIECKWDERASERESEREERENRLEIRRRLKRRRFVVELKVFEIEVEEKKGRLQATLVERERNLFLD